MDEAPADARTAELGRSLAQLRARIAAACSAVGREPDEITVVSVTKFFPVEDARRLVELGAVDLGESRDQEARPKAQALPQARWHFIGRLQKNKARSVASYADVVHSVDRVELADALAAGVRRADRPALPVFAQVNLDDADSEDPSGSTVRGGATLAGIDALADHIATLPELELAGLMAIAPLDVDPAPAFARLSDASRVVQQRFPRARAISAGMSGDLEAAIAAGATHVRVGTALLGRRPPTVG